MISLFLDHVMPCFLVNVMQRKTEDRIRRAKPFLNGQYFDARLFLQVPSLNDVPLHYLKPNSLVKFRCLVQDMFDPEFYMGVYEAIDPATKSKASLVYFAWI